MYFSRSLWCFLYNVYSATVSTLFTNEEEKKRILENYFYHKSNYLFAIEVIIKKIFTKNKEI